MQYVYGFIDVELSNVSTYSNQRVDAVSLDENTYVGVDNLLQNKQGKTKSNYCPDIGKLTKYNIEDILIGNIRPYLKKIWLADNNGGASGDVLVISPYTELIVPKYLYYILSSESFFEYDNSKTKGAKMPRGDKDLIMKYIFSLPSLEEQKRIVEILDNFDKIINDISNGLPAEIDARQKQYEYYREKLLNFKRKN